MAAAQNKSWGKRGKGPTLEQGAGLCHLPHSLCQESLSLIVELAPVAMWVSLGSHWVLLTSLPPEKQLLEYLGTLSLRRHLGALPHSAC